MVLVAWSFNMAALLSRHKCVLTQISIHLDMTIAVPWFRLQPDKHPQPTFYYKPGYFPLLTALREMSQHSYRRCLCLFALCKLRAAQHARPPLASYDIIWCQDVKLQQTNELVESVFKLKLLADLFLF